ncbi:MAG: hypothetical protein R3D62_09680 [Xanthobacteraceae bacterium]
MFLSRNLLLPLAALIGAAIVDGVFAAEIGSPARAWAGWPIVGGLAVLVIAALVAQVRAATDDDPDADAHFTAINGQTTLLAAALVVAGIALLLGTTAPGNPPANELAFPAWAGVVTVLMGFVLTVAKHMIGIRRTAPFVEPWTPGGPHWSPRERPRAHPAHDAGSDAK